MSKNVFSIDELAIYLLTDNNRRYIFEFVKQNDFLYCSFDTVIIYTYHGIHGELYKYAVSRCCDDIHVYRIKEDEIDIQKIDQNNKTYIEKDTYILLVPINDYNICTINCKDSNCGVHISQYTKRRIGMIEWTDIWFFAHIQDIKIPRIDKEQLVTLQKCLMLWKLSL